MRALVGIGGRGCALELLEARRLLSTTAQIQIEARFLEVSFTDRDGTFVNMGLRGVGGFVTLEGENLTHSQKGNRVDVSGTVDRIGSVMISGSDGQSSVSIRGRGGDGMVELAYIGSFTPLRAIDAPSAILTGNLYGVGIGSITLGEANGATMVVNSHPDIASTSLRAGEVLWSSFESASPVSVLWADSWSGGEIRAPSISHLRVLGNMFGEMKLTGSGTVLDRGEIGNLGFGKWTLAGDARSMQARNVSIAWVGEMTRLGQLWVTDNFRGSLTAERVGWIDIGGHMANATLKLTGGFDPDGLNLNSLKVGGRIDWSTIDSIGNVGSVSASGMRWSTLLAGVNGTELPQAATDFAYPTSIGRLSVGFGGSSSGLTGSKIAAYRIGTMFLNDLDLTGGTQIATTEIGLLVARVPVIGEVPVIGKLFQQKDVTKQDDLLLLLTPTIIIVD